MLSSGTLTTWLTIIDRARLAQVPLRQKQGMLHTMEDLVEHCGHCMIPYLPVMMALTVVLLETVVVVGGGGGRSGGEQVAVVQHEEEEEEEDAGHEDEEEEDDDDENNEEHKGEEESQPTHPPVNPPTPTSPLFSQEEPGRKALTSGSLRLLAVLLRHAPSAHDYNALWGRLMPCALQLAPRLANEVWFVCVV